MPTFCEQLQYILRLSNGVILDTSFTYWTDMQNENRIKIEMILLSIFKNAVKYSKNLKL